MSACVAAVSVFLLQVERSNKGAAERRSAPEVNRKLTGSGKGESEKEVGVGSLDSPPPLTPYFFTFARSFVPLACFVGNALHRLIQRRQPITSIP